MSCALVPLQSLPVPCISLITKYCENSRTHYVRDTSTGIAYASVLEWASPSECLSVPRYLLNLIDLLEELGKLISITSSKKENYPRELLQKIYLLKIDGLEMASLFYQEVDTCLLLIKKYAQESRPKILPNIRTICLSDPELRNCNEIQEFLARRVWIAESKATRNVAIEKLFVLIEKSRNISLNSEQIKQAMEIFRILKPRQKGINLLLSNYLKASEKEEEGDKKQWLNVAKNGWRTLFSLRSTSNSKVHPIL